MNIHKSYKVTDLNTTTNLTDKNYKAAGGQAAVFCKGDLAYKIYHDPKKMIPMAKIQELSLLKHDNIIAPISPLFDHKTTIPVGFTMRYVKDIEFLCQIFTKTFRNDKSVSPTDIVELVTQMQKTLQYVHSMKFLVVDYNEMNFLLDKLISMVFYIDVDSWKTPSFNADALMDSVRDRTTKPGVFSELSDWFSWAVVTFQMYTGIHPFKGRHPDFKPKEWPKRMDLGVSVFDPKIKLPPACQDFSLIPKRQLDWYKAVFVNNERSAPPFADSVVGGAVVKLIGSKGDFIVKELMKMNKSIKSMFYVNNRRFILTSEGLFDNQGKMVFPALKSALIGMCEVFNEQPVIAQHIGNEAAFYDLKGDVVSTVRADAMMGSNNIAYTINAGELVQNTFERLGNLIHVTDAVCNISSSYKVFKGVVVQDDFAKIHLAIPFDKNMCINMYIKELDGQRILNARYEKGVCIIITENQNKYMRYILYFNNDHSKYTIREEEVIDLHSANFIVLPNKICIALDDEKLAIFVDNNKRKEITNCPFDVSMRLYHEEMQVLFVDQKRLYSVTMK